MPSQEIATRSPTVVPAALAEIGVHMATDASGYRMIAFPAELAQKVNILLPVQEIAQADPNFTPSLRLVQLNAQAHAYRQGDKQALNKQALEILASSAGIFDTQTKRVPKAELEEGEIGYEATVKIRRSDGTIDTIKRDKIVVIEVEKNRIWEETKAWGERGSKSREVVEAEAAKRWMKERGDIYAKCESKAVLRAIRAALQIPHGFTMADFAKPFLVVGYSFTPDWNDPETKRLLVAAGVGATDALYGRERHSDATALPPAPEPAEAVLPAPQAADVPEPDGDFVGPEPGAEPEPEAEPEPDPEPEPNPDDDIPFGDDGPDASGQLPADVEAAGAVVLSFGKYKGETIAEVAESDASYLAWLCGDKITNPFIRTKARTYAAAVKPEVL